MSVGTFPVVKSLRLLVLLRFLYSVSVREQELEATGLTTIHMYVTNTRFSGLDVVGIGKVTSISG